MQRLFWKEGTEKNWLIPISILLIGCLHTLIFAIFQIPGNFLFALTGDQIAIYAKSIFYGCAILTSLFHQIVCRYLGLRKSLQIGLFFNLLGLCVLLYHHFTKGNTPEILLWIDMVFFGISLTSVINALVTYAILKFPKRTGPAITLLFAVFNAGVLLAPIMLNFFHRHGGDRYAYFVLILGMILSMIFVHFCFSDPHFPRHLDSLRKGSLIWKELHYRLVLFLIAIIFYGLVETTFSLWGLEQIGQILNAYRANNTISLLWLFMIVGQLILLFPLYVYPAKRIFYALVLLVITAAWTFPMQHTLVGFAACLILAGLGCSAMFPILLSMMEKEFLRLTDIHHLLPFVETGTSVMIAGYFLGIGLIDLSLELRFAIPISSYFHLAALLMSFTGMIALYLNLTVDKSHPHSRY